MSLYFSAESLEAYADRSTLDQRLCKLSESVMTIPIQTEGEENPTIFPISNVKDRRIVIDLLLDPVPLNANISWHRNYRRAMILNV